MAMSSAFSRVDFREGDICAFDIPLCIAAM